MSLRCSIARATPDLATLDLHLLVFAKKQHEDSEDRPHRLYGNILINNRAKAPRVLLVILLCVDSASTLVA